MIVVSFKSGQRRTPQVQSNSEYFLVNLRNSANPHIWRPPTDAYELDDSIVVRVEISGMSENDFLISLESNVLVIRGIRPDINERRAYHQMEINFGEFLTMVELSVAIDSEHVHAEYQNGFLRVTLPKAQPKSIKIQENE
jgi:HSP20 family protein